MLRRLSLVSLCLLFTSQMQASGITTHMFMSKKAAQDMAAGDLKDFLKTNEQVFVFASIFPDSGYVEKDIIAIVNEFLPWWPESEVRKIVQGLPHFGFPDIGTLRLSDDHFYGEISHWWPFLSAYRNLILERCPNDAAASCPQLVAHWLGCAAHSIQDHYFDRHFIPQVADRYFSGNLSAAASSADVGIDMFILSKQGAPLLGNFSDLVPFSFLVDLYQRLPADLVLEDLQRGTSLLAWVYAAEKRVAPVARIKYMMSLPWVYSNYVNAKGGVDDTSQKTAQYLQKLWLQLKNRDSSHEDVRESLLE